MLQFLPIAPDRLEDIQHQTAKDMALQKLRATISNGWPENRNSISDLIVPYFDERDELTIQNGIIFKGDRAVIPQALRRDMLKRIHFSHLGVEGCLRRARESVYWPQMNAEVKDFIQKCETCRTFDTNQGKEPLKHHEVPPRPWAKLVLDIFTYGRSSKSYELSLPDMEYQNTACQTMVHNLHLKNFLTSHRNGNLNT